MKINQRVKIWKATDDNNYASNCFGVEAQNDWLSIQYYPEQIEAIIIWNKGLLLAQHVFKGKNGEMRGNVYDISKNGIHKRIEETNDRIQQYCISMDNFFEDSSISSLSEFYNVISIN